MRSGNLNAGPNMNGKVSQQLDRNRARSRLTSFVSLYDSDLRYRSEQNERKS
jgi:hypothetical protein